MDPIEFNSVAKVLQIFCFYLVVSPSDFSFILPFFFFFFFFANDKAIHCRTRNVQRFTLYSGNNATCAIRYAVSRNLYQGDNERTMRSQQGEWPTPCSLTAKWCNLTAN